MEYTLEMYTYTKTVCIHTWPKQNYLNTEILNVGIGRYLRSSVAFKQSAIQSARPITYCET